MRGSWGGYKWKCIWEGGLKGILGLEGLLDGWMVSASIEQGFKGWYAFYFQEV